MKKFKKALAFFLAAAMAAQLAGCGKPEGNASSGTDEYKQNSAALTLSGAWNYDSQNDVCWKLDVPYTAPASGQKQLLAVYIPGAYMKRTEKLGGVYDTLPDANGKVGAYTAKTAPVIFFADTPDYKAQMSPAAYDYSVAADYLKAGFVVVQAGTGGEAQSGATENTATAPWGAACLKAAIRWYRFNADVLPGDTDRFFVCGAAEGGNLAAVVGASGDSALYTPYLEAAGAAMTGKDGRELGDAVCGAACWSPVTGLDAADAAYEWSIGQYDAAGTRADGTWTAALSEDLAADYPNYINQIGLKDDNGNSLKLTKTVKGIYNGGSYYVYLMSELENALSAFLSETQFPYTPAVSDGASVQFAPGSGTPFAQPTPSGSATYATPKDYVDALNADLKWVVYNASTNRVKILSMEAFVQHCKNASSDVCAFDDLRRGQPENKLFGTETDGKLHFDAMLFSLLQKNENKYKTYSDWNETLIDDFTADLKKTDALGTAVSHRAILYEPLYWLSGYYAGSGASKPAAHWRIRASVGNSMTPITGETNLALALRHVQGVSDVDFAEVWQQSGTMAERSGTVAENFVVWVDQCVQTTQSEP